MKWKFLKTLDYLTQTHMLFEINLLAALLNQEVSSSLESRFQTGFDWQFECEPIN